MTREDAKKTNAKKPSAFHELVIAPVLRLMDKMSGREVPGAKKKKPATRRAA